MKSEKYTIRDATIAEAERLTAIAVRAKGHWGYDEEFMAACQAELQVSVDEIRNDRIRVAEDYNGQPAGFYHLLPEHAAGAFELEAMFVDPPCIGCGIGKLLWQDLVQFLKSTGAETLLVQSDPQAEGFYLQMGMQRTGERESDSIPGRMLPLLELGL